MEKFFTAQVRLFIISTILFIVLGWASLDEGRIMQGLLFLSVPVIMYLVKRVHSVFLVRRKELQDEKKRDRTSKPRRLGRRLLDDETKGWEGRMHPVAVLRWWVLLTVSPFGGIYLAVKSGSLIIGLLVCVAAMVYAGLRILVDWWIVWIAITNKRFIRVEGLLRVNTLAVQLSSLRILHESETFGSRGSYWLGLGDYITVYTDTPAQNEPFKHTSHMPDRHAVMALLDKHIPRDAEQDTESSGILRQILGLLQKALGPSEAKKSQGGEKDDR